MTRKINWPIVVTVVCVILFVGVLWYGFKTGTFSFSSKQKNNQSTQKEEETKVNRTDYTDVARKTLDWIDKQRNADGWYILERGCDLEKKTCDTVWDNKEGNKDGLIATWARLNFYEQHKDTKDLEIVKKDIDIFYDKYKNDNLKDSLWICKITYEMAQSKYIDQGQKEKLKELCLDVEYPIPKEVEEYWVSKKNEFKEKLGNNKEPWRDWDVFVLVLRSFDSSLGYPTDFLYKYRWEKDKLNLKLAKEYLETVKNIYEGEKENLPLRKTIKYTDDVCILGISSLDMYILAGKDKEYLVYVEKLYDEAINSIGSKNEYLTPICGLFLNNLYQITKNQKYLSNLEINNSNLVAVYLDGFRIKTNDNNGFFMSNDKNNYVRSKDVVENGLIVEMLRI